MSADRRPSDRGQGGCAPAEMPAAASLLSVPIFRAAARQQAARRGAPAPAAAPAAEAPAQAPTPAGPDARRADTPALPPAPAAANAAPYTVIAGSPSAPAPQDAPGPARPAPALKAVAGAQGFRTLLDYWRSLARQGRAPVAQLDAALIAERWPYAMLIRVPRGGVVDIVQVFAPEPASAPAAPGGAQHPFARDQASQISSWVLEIAQEAAGSRQPSRHTETFHQAGRPRRITAELLPCQAEGDPADHLLLQLRDG